MKRQCWILAPSLVAVALAQMTLMPMPARAQSGEVVQPTPSAAAVDSLNRNLASLSRNPQDETALLGAAQAALDLGDVQAANGFFTRANMVNPQLGKAKLGLAVVQIALRQPDAAAENFDAAQALGEPATGHLADRGLAYDLTGQQEKAQRDYVAAMRANPGNEEARLRYAVSLGISGKVADADRQLEQPLADGDREAWRMRAFIFAMNGRLADARKVTQAVMPKGLADSLDPYMQRLPLLTRSQKALATFYGEFPADMLKLAAPAPVKERDVQVAAAATERENSRRDRRSRTAAADRRQTPAPAPAPAPSKTLAAAPASARAVTPAPATPKPAATTPPPASPAARPVVQQPSAKPPVRPDYEAPTTVSLAASNAAPARPASVQGPADPDAALAAAPARATTPAPAPVSASVTPEAKPAGPGFSPAAEPIATHSFGDMLAGLSIPEAERKSAPVAADLRVVARIQDQRRKADDAAAAKAKATADAKEKADIAKKAEAERKAQLAANPSRNWVQVATGRDVDALAFDLRRLRRSYADAFNDEAGWTAQWGATRRLVIGPFKKLDDAKAVVTQITKSGGDAFLWQSEAGEEVTKLGTK